MNASFAVEVQLNVRELVSIESGSFFERVPEGRGASTLKPTASLRQVNNRVDSTLDGKFSPEPDLAIDARNFAEFSKPQILQPDRGFGKVVAGTCNHRELTLPPILV